VTEAFTLDPFQRQAIAAIDRGESVLVAAPTGAGKTVVAEHAVARVLEERAGRVFYTTPIKALSNQKYGDLVRRHGPDQVGLLTGDNSINGDARVVVMTTEVLRNMIYAGRPLDDLRFVVLDEVHYLQDTYRGPVWEEVIIHVPAHVRLVCLSATVSNADELAAWLTEVRGPTATVIESHRPVELEHLYAVADGVEDRLRVVPTLVHERPNPDGPEFDAERLRGRGPGGRRRHRWFTPDRAELVDHLEDEGLLPTIVFVFSRAGCDDGARYVARSRARLTTADERDRIDEIVDEHVRGLSDRDLAALQFGAWRDGLQAGVAAHHAGMVPPFKEAVEACFVEGLVKVVFATETLALGINMPARSVVISSLSKFTGERHERLTPSQYTQLTGRAGRRGIDDHGTAIVLWSPYVPFSDVAALAASRRFELRSAFRPTYNMAANLVRRHDPETAHRLLSLSFAQFQTDRALVRAERGVDGRRMELAELAGDLECERGDVQEYLARLDAGQAQSRQRPSQRLVEDRLSELSPGDVVDAPLRDGHERVAVLSVAHRAQGRVRVRAVNRTGKVLTFGSQTVTAPPVVLGELELPEPYRPNNQKFRNEVARRLERARTRRPSESNRERPDPEDHPVAGCPDVRRHLRAARRARRLHREIDAHQKRQHQDAGSLTREFDRVLQVLDGRGFLEGWALSEAGERLARLYHESDLLVAEALEEGLLDGLDGPDLVALLSCFTYEHRSPEPAPAPQFPNVRLRGRWDELAQLADGLVKEEAALSLRLTREPDPGFVPLAHEWTQGDHLDQVLGDDDVTGGDFVRQMRQLLDLLRQIAEVAPDPSTRHTARSAIGRVDRGVVAASSAISIT